LSLIQTSKMQFSAYDQAILDMTVARNIDVTNTPYDPEWASSQTNLTVRTQMRNVGFNSFLFNRAFFEAYPSLRDYKQDFFNVALEFGNEEVAIAMQTLRPTVDHSHLHCVVHAFPRSNGCYPIQISTSMSLWAI